MDSLPSNSSNFSTQELRSRPPSPPIPHPVAGRGWRPEWPREVCDASPTRECNKVRISALLAGRCSRFVHRKPQRTEDPQELWSRFLFCFPLYQSRGRKASKQGLCVCTCVPTCMGPSAHGHGCVCTRVCVRVSPSSSPSRPLTLPCLVSSRGETHMVRTRGGCHQPHE